MDQVGRGERPSANDFDDAAVSTSFSSFSLMIRVVTISKPLQCCGLTPKGLTARMLMIIR